MRFPAVRTALSLAVASYLFLGMSSCATSSIQEACQGQLPDLSLQLKKVARDVAVLTPDGYPTRAIASVDGSAKAETTDPERMNRVVTISTHQRDQWQSWSEKGLVQVEHYLDFVRTRSELRPLIAPLSDLADQLVRFDGYVDQGKAYQAISTLHHAQNDADTVIRQVCGNPL